MASVKLWVLGPDGKPCALNTLQRAVLESPARIKVVAAGRQSGKTTGIAIFTVERCVRRQLRGWIVAPTYRLTNESWRRIQRLFANVHERFPVVKRSNQFEIELTNGTLLEKRSGHEPDNLRGGTLDLLIVDEAAFLSDESWHTLFPTTIVRKAEVLLTSTPFGRNWFYQEWLKGQGPNRDPEYESWQFPSTVNEYFTADDLEKARVSWPETIFRREYLAEFIDSGLEVFPTPLIERCIGGILGEPERDKMYVAGIDLAKHQDFSVIVVMDNTGHVRAFDRFQQLDWGTQKERIARMLTRYNATGWIDSTGVGDPIFDDLRAAGLSVKPFRFTEDRKRQLVENLIVAMENGLIRYPPIEVLIHELKIFQRAATKDGRVHYAHPAGQHDDCVMALALAAWGLAHTAPLEIQLGRARRLIS